MKREKPDISPIIDDERTEVAGVPRPRFRERAHDAVRRELAEALAGDGVEFGPGCYPLPLGPAVRSIRYCDLHDRRSFLYLFPETAGNIADFPDRIDFRLDFGKDWFVEEIGKGALDFVVASHVLEHLVNPIRFLEQCHELLAPGGILYLALPDKRAMFDRYRPRTRLEHVVRRYQSNESDLSEEQIAQFVRQVNFPGETFAPGSPDYDRVLDNNRRRSIHVNVWILDDLIELFGYLGRDLKMAWELLDGRVLSGEFLLLFRKADDLCTLDRYPITLSRIWAESHRYLIEREVVRLELLLHERLLVLDERAREVQNLVRRLKRIVRFVPGVSRLERWLKAE